MEEYLSGKRRYRINRDHPVIASLLQGGTGAARLARAAFCIIERSVPVERIWLDVSESAEAPATAADVDAALVDDLVTALRASASDRKPDEVLDSLLRTLRLDAPALRATVLSKFGESS